MTLIKISSPEYDVDLALAYATADNITGRPIYLHAACWLHSDAAAALARAIVLARELDLKFRIFDAYRPVEAQWKLWNHDPNPAFLTDPRSGSPHSRGIAIDLTLVRIVWLWKWVRRSTISAPAHFTTVQLLRRKFGAIDIYCWV